MTDPPLAGLVIAAPLLGWPMFLLLYYAELVAVAVAFRPRLIATWGLLLILFHLGTGAFMGIAFTDHVVWNALFMVLAPQADPRAPWRAQLADLPLVGVVIRILGGARGGATSGSARP